MANFAALVNKVLREADILLLVVDARRVEESINRELEKKIERLDKKFLYVVNKVDLITEAEQKKIKLRPSIQISALKHLSTVRLLKKIMAIAGGKPVTVGVIGFPNTGKSTIINSLKGRHSAPTSSRAGFTRSLQKVRISNKLTLIDTPGVFSYKQKNINHIVIGSIDTNKLKDPEGAAIELIDTLNGKIERYYDVKKHEDPSDTLEEIAIKNNILKKGGIPDVARMGKQIIVLWQKGTIR